MWHVDLGIGLAGDEYVQGAGLGRPRNDDRPQSGSLHNGSIGINLETARFCAIHVRHVAFSAMFIQDWPDVCSVTRLVVSAAGDGHQGTDQDGG